MIFWNLVQKYAFCGHPNPQLNKTSFYSMFCLKLGTVCLIDVLQHAASLLKQHKTEWDDGLPKPMHAALEARWKGFQF